MYKRANVYLGSVDGNAFAILDAAGRAMKKAGYTKEERAAYRTEATSGDYDHLLLTTITNLSVS